MFKNVLLKNPNLRILIVVLFASSTTAVLTIWESPYNPVLQAAAIMSVSASVPPTVENGGIQPQNGPPPVTPILVNEPESIPVVQEDSVEIGEDISSTDTGSLSRTEQVFSHIQSFFSSFEHARTTPTRGEIEAFIQEEIEDLTEEEIQELYAMTEQEVYKAQENAENEAIGTLQRALITLSILLMLGMGVMMLI